MKRARQILAILAASVLTFGMVTTVSAADYEDLKVTSKIYYGDGGRDHGVYPVVDGMASLNTEIVDAIWKALGKVEVNRGDKSDGNLFKSSYTVTNENQYAVVEITLRYQSPTDFAGTKTESIIRYIDKESKKEITEAEYNEGIEAQAAEGEEIEEEEEEKEEETTEEIVLLPLAKHAEDLGYTVTYLEELNAVRLSKDGKWRSVTVGKNQYVVGGKLEELEAAPSIQDDIVYVPVSYFEKVLGADVSFDKSGNVTIK